MYGVAYRDGYDDGARVVRKETLEFLQTYVDVFKSSNPIFSKAIAHVTAALKDYYGLDNEAGE